MADTSGENQSPSLASGTSDKRIEWELLLKGEHVWLSWPGQADSLNLGPAESVCTALRRFLATAG